MKQTEKFFSHACMYAVFITIAFYIFSNAFSAAGLSMTFTRFLTIFAFSMIISSMEYIFTVTKINKFLQYLINYVVLCIAFNVVFFSIRKTSADYIFGASTIFAAIVLFTFGYAFVILGSIALRSVLAKSQKSSRNNAKSAPDYQSRFK